MAKATKRHHADQEAVSPIAKRSKPSKRNHGSHTEDVQDSEEDPGRSASLEFLNAAKESAKRSEAAVMNHTAFVKEQQERLTNSLEEKASKIKSQEARFQEIFLALLSSRQPNSIAKDGDPPTLPPHRSSSIIYQTGKTIAASSRTVIAEYDNLCKQIVSKHAAKGENVNQQEEHQALQQLLSRHAHKTKLDVRRLLHGDSPSSDQEIESNSWVADDALWTRFAKNIAKDGTDGEAETDGVGHNHGWAKIANNIQKGVQRMVRGLPKDDDI